MEQRNHFYYFSHLHPIFSVHSLVASIICLPFPQLNSLPPVRNAFWLSFIYPLLSLLTVGEWSGVIFALFWWIQYNKNISLEWIDCVLSKGQNNCTKNRWSWILWQRTSCLRHPECRVPFLLLSPSYVMTFLLQLW